MSLPQHHFGIRGCAFARLTRRHVVTTTGQAIQVQLQDSVLFHYAVLKQFPTPKTSVSR